MQKIIITRIGGVLIGSTAFSTKPSISQSPKPTPTELTPKSRRLTIAVSVRAMSDLKVTEGQTLQTGDTIADRALDLQRLKAQKAKLILTLAYCYREPGSSDAGGGRSCDAGGGRSCDAGGDGEEG
jgi:hypothetical protein